MCFADWCSWLTVFYLVVVALITWLSSVYIDQKNKFKYWTSRGIAGPQPQLFVGNMLDGFKTPVIDLYVERTKQFGHVYGVYEQTAPQLVISDPELIKQITIKDFHVFTDRKKFGDMFDSSTSKFLSQLSGEEWKRVRTLLSPTFTPRNMKKMFNIMNECVANSIKSLKKSSLAEDETLIDLKAFFEKYSLDVIARCLFATKPELYNYPEDVFLSAAKNLFKPNLAAVTLFFLIPRPLFKLLGLKCFQPEPMVYFKNLARALVAERKKSGIRGEDFLQLLVDASNELKSTATNERNSEFVQDKEGHHDVVDDSPTSKLSANDAVTRASNRHLDDDEVIAQAVQFFSAGHETTSTLLAFAFYQLAISPTVQVKLYREILTVAGNLTYENLSGLEYLDAFIQETLRMYPPAVVLDREAAEDYRIPGTDLTISKGTQVQIPVCAVHYDASNYEEPEQFRPERFLPEQRAKLRPCTYLPFGAGRRNCIGNRFALLESKLIVARTVLEFRLSRSDKTDVPPRFAKATGLLRAEPLLVRVDKRSSL